MLNVDDLLGYVFRLQLVCQYL